MNLELTEERLVLIGKMLDEIPYKFAAPIIAEINKAILEQREKLQEIERQKLEDESNRNKPVENNNGHS